jgi:hypothetical protein
VEHGEDAVEKEKEECGAKEETKKRSKRKMRSRSRRQQEEYGREQKKIGYGIYTFLQSLPLCPVATATLQS